MTRSGLWRKGVAVALIVLLLFVAAAISAPAVEANWTEGDPFYTYDYVYFSPILDPGGEALSFDITIGINWGDWAQQQRDVPTDMIAIWICPEDGYNHLDIYFTPSTFTLEMGQTKTVAVTVSAKAEAAGNNYFIQIEGVDSVGGTPYIWGFIPRPEGRCWINPAVILGEPGCFIATAAYGTPLAEEIEVLRQFRDEVLLQNSLGSQFVNFYYEVSPPLADFLSGHELLRTLVRELLVDPVVWVVDAIGILWRD